jgi:rhodanese-related sulfurtransferase
MKKLIIEIFCIVVLSCILGLVYNYFSSAPLPLIRIEKQFQQVNDSLLDSLASKPDTIKKQVADNIKIQPGDTAKANSLIDTITKKITKDTNIKKNIKAISKRDILIEAARKAKKTKLDIKTLTYDQVSKNIYNKNFILIDARRHEDYQSGRIGNAINAFPLSENKDIYLRTISSIPYDKIIVTYCEGGAECDLAEQVCKDLFSFGYTKVYLYHGGWEEWTKKRGFKK